MHSPIAGELPYCGLAEELAAIDFYRYYRYVYNVHNIIQELYIQKFYT